MAKQRMRIEIVKTGERITLKKFKRESTQMLVENSVTKKEIIDSKILTRAEFAIQDIFDIRAGRRLTKADMVGGKKPFIGATDNNNGITNFVSNDNASNDKNVLVVNYNGSVVETFYHPYESIFSDDVKRFSLKNHEGNKHVYLFLKSVILKQKEKYRYGYKFNEGRMSKQKILLPVNQKVEPDYIYMEKFARNLHAKLLRDYVTYLKKRLVNVE